MTPPQITLGSLFDGIGGFPLAGTLCGITPVWASEIEPFPTKVTTARFPDMKQLGDVTKINGADIEPVDIITFGSPCQNLSIAGTRSGLNGERSGLFYEAIRIIKEMRSADRKRGRTDVDIRPRFAVWENVPGAFSTNNGEDFRAVLQAFANIAEDRGGSAPVGLDVPRPPKKFFNGKWYPRGGWSVMDGALRGASMTLNTGASPSVARESTLSQILEANAPTKYSLSPKASLGILRRAERRNRPLPSIMREALEEVVRSASASA